MSLFEARRPLNRLLLAIEGLLVAALLSVIVDITLTLQAINDAAESQQARAALVGGAGAEAARSADGSRAVNRASLPAARPLRPPVLPAGAAVLAPQPEAPADKAHRLQIPAIGVDSLIYEGWDEESLRLGVGRRPGSPAPGEAGNLLLSAHNDIHGAIFRHLDRLQPGDAVYISTENVLYTYLVRDVLVVSADSIWVTLPTAQATATLISCYPYLLDTQRIVVFADFAG
jgi:sortase A